MKQPQQLLIELLQGEWHDFGPTFYVHDYKKRWPIEKLFRTSKQHLGTAECFSTQLETQEKHIAAVLLAYAIDLMRNSQTKKQLLHY